MARPAAGLGARPPVVPYDLGGTLSNPAKAPPPLSLATFGATAAGLPASFDLSSYVARVYDQQTVPACACYSAAAMQSIFEAIERRAWMAFDALECYHALGGTGAVGVDSTAVLEYAQTTGFLAAGTVHRYRLKSYGTVRLGSAGQLEPVKAAIANNRSVVLSMLLPTDWGQNAGQSSAASVSGTLHQVCLTGYDANRLYFVNSQGSAWGDEGFGSVPATFVLGDDQDPYCYAYTAIDAVDDN